MKRSHDLRKIALTLLITTVFLIYPTESSQADWWSDRRDALTGGAKDAWDETKDIWDNIKTIVDPAGVSEELWGEAGRLAYQAAAATMAKRSPTGVSMNDLLKHALRPHVSGLVDRITLHWGTPALDEWAASKFRIQLTDTESAAQTYGHDIYIRQQEPATYDRDLVELIIHELTHTQQYERYDSSLSNFGYHYFKKYKKAGQNYGNNELEREARSNAERLINSVYNTYRNPVLSNQTITTTTVYEADSITAGPAFRIEHPGDVTFRAGGSIRLVPDFTVKSGSKFRASIDPALR